MTNSPEKDQAQDPILFFWEKFSHVESTGRRLIRFKDRSEVDLLYQAGFVDTERFSPEEWREAFKDLLQNDGSYLLSQKQWTEKAQYLYAGAVQDPFDPAQMREGEWDAEKLEKFLEEKISPAVLVTSEEFRKKMEPIRAYIAAGRRVVIGTPFKFALKQLLDAYPSPRRLRELGFAAVKRAVSLNPSRATGFSSGPSAAVSALDKLSKLIKK